MFIEYYQYLQYFALIASIFFFKGLRQFNIEGFVLLLLIVCVTETTANYLSNVLNREDNFRIYNFYLLVSTPVSLFLYYKMLHLKGAGEKIYFYISFLCSLLIAFNLCFVQGPDTFNSYSIVIIMLINIAFNCLIILNLVNTDDPGTRLLKHPYFWINSSSLLFSLSTLVVLGLREYILSNHISIGDKSIYRYIVPASNVILYSAHAYAFYLCPKSNQITK